jgi:hypothetical protein
VNERPGGGSATGLALAGLHLLLGLLLFEPILFPGGDNAGYMILGDALASGEGYRDIYLPSRPLHTKYPPLYPLLLAVLTPLGALQLFKLASLALTTLSVWLTYCLVGRLIDRRSAAVAAGLFAVSPVLLDYSHWVLSEALFVVLVTASLIGLERCSSGISRGNGRSDARIAFSVGLVGAAGAFLTRTAGLPLLGAAVLSFALARQWKRAGLSAAVALVVAGGWGTYQGRVVDAAGDAAPTYLEEMLLLNPYDPALGSAGASDLLVRATDNAWTYVTGVLPTALVGRVGVTSEPGALLALLGLMLAGLAFAGWARRSMSRLGPAELFTVLYAFMLVLWPPVWTDQRFLLPMLPLLLAYAAAGVSTLGEGLAARSSLRWIGAAPVVALIAIVGIGAASSVLAVAPDRIRCLADYRAGAPCDPPAFASFYRAAEWTRDRTAPDAVVVNRKPRIFFWISGRQGDVYRFSTDTREVLDGLEAFGTDYVVVDAVSGTTARYLVPMLREFMPKFEIVYEGGDPPTFVLRFDPEPVAAD